MLAHRAARSTLIAAMLMATLVPLVPSAAAAEYGTWGTPTRLTTGPQSTAVNDFAVDNTTVVSVSSSAAGSVHVSYSLNRGETWTHANPVTASQSTGVGVAIVNSTTWYVSIEGAPSLSVYRTTDRGATWTLRSSTAATLTNYINAGCAPTGTGWDGHDLGYDPATQTLIVARSKMTMPNCNGGTSWSWQFLASTSTDGGTTWTPTIAEHSLSSGTGGNPADGQAPSVFIAPSNWNIVTATTGPVKYWQTKDNAATAWVLQNLPTSGTLNIASARVWSNGLETTIVGKHELTTTTWGTYGFHRDVGGTWTGGNIADLPAKDLYDRDTLYHDGERLWHLARELSGNPKVRYSLDDGATWSTPELVPAKFGRQVAFVGILGGLRLVGFDFDSPNRIMRIDRDVTFYVSAKNERGALFPRALADIETNRGYRNETFALYVREIGDGQLGTNAGRVLKLDGGLHVVKAADPCTGDFSAPGSLRGLRYTWDNRVVTVCENHVESPSQANIRVLMPDLTGGHIYGYPQTEVLGPFLIRSTGVDSLGYATFGNLQKPSQARFDHAQQHENVRFDVIPNLTDVAVDEGGNYDRYLALSDDGVWFFGTDGAELDSFDDATFATGGKAAVMKGPIVHILDSAGLQRWNYPLDGGSINKVQGGLNPLTGGAGTHHPSAYTQGTGNVKWSKDHQYVIVWSANHAWILTAAGLATVYETPVGLLGDGNTCPVRGADMDFANNYLYLAMCNDVLELQVYDWTTSTGDDSNPAGTPNSPPDPLDDPALEDPSIDQDTDDDTLPDSWELDNFGNLTQDAEDDPDGDGATNAEEQQGGTSPQDETEIPPASTGGGGGGGGGNIAGADGTSPMIWVIAAIACVGLLGVVFSRRRKR